MTSSIDHVPDSIRELASDIRSEGGRALVVGGANRDALLGLPVKDYDLEVYGIEPGDLLRHLQQKHHVEVVGASFGVYLLPKLGLDVSIPREEKDIGPGHRDFQVECDPFLSVEQAALRRDFTINAIYRDPLSGEWIDPHGGRDDLNHRLLRPVSERFKEDPLRVLRAMQFASRFRLDWSPELLDYARSLTQEHLPVERIETEWKKLIVQGVEIARGLRFLQESGWLRFYPELEAMVGCPQDPEWHPEGDVWVHTLHCMDAFASALRTGDAWEDWVTGLGVLCHDMGKPPTTAEVEGRIRAISHEIVGVPIAETFLQRITRQKLVAEEVLPLVRYHMQPHALARSGVGDKALRKFILKVHPVERLLRVVEADRRGRPPLPWQPAPELDWLRGRLEALALYKEPPKPILLGRHLMELGHSAGPHLGKLLRSAFEAQLSGEFSDLATAKDWFARQDPEQLLANQESEEA